MRSQGHIIRGNAPDLPALRSTYTAAKCTTRIKYFYIRLFLISVERSPARRDGGILDERDGERLRAVTCGLMVKWESFARNENRTIAFSSFWKNKRLLSSLQSSRGRLFENFKEGRGKWKKVGNYGIWRALFVSSSAWLEIRERTTTTTLASIVLGEIARK